MMRNLLVLALQLPFVASQICDNCGCLDNCGGCISYPDGEKDGVQQYNPKCVLCKEGSVLSDPACSVDDTNRRDMKCVCEGGASLPTQPSTETLETEIPQLPTTQFPTAQIPTAQIPTQNSQPDTPESDNGDQHDHERCSEGCLHCKNGKCSRCLNDNEWTMKDGICEAKSKTPSPSTSSEKMGNGAIAAVVVACVGLIVLLFFGVRKAIQNMQRGRDVKANPSNQKTPTKPPTTKSARSFAASSASFSSVAHQSSFSQSGRNRSLRGGVAIRK